MSMLLVYLFITMDSLVFGLVIGLSCAGLGLIIGLCCFIDAESPRLGRKFLKWSFPAFILVGLLLIAVPSTKQFAAIYMIPKVVNNEDVRAISNDALKVLRIKFDAYIDSISPVKEVVKAVKTVDTKGETE